MFDTQRAQRVHNRVGERRERTGAARLANALHAERAYLARRRMLFARDALNQARARHAVIHKAAGQQLAGRAVIDDVLGQDLAGAHRDAAVELAFDDGVVDHRAEIVHCEIRDNLRRAGRRIDLDLGNVAAVRERRAELAFGGDADRLRLGDVTQLERALHVFRAEHAPGVFHLRGLDAKLESGGGAAVLDQFLRGEMTDAARAHRRARAAGMVALQLVLLLRRALHDLHALERDAQRVRYDHRERGFVTVTLRLGLRVHGDVAGSIEQHLDVVFRRRARTSVLDHGRNSDAAQLALFLGLRPALRVAFPVGELQRLLQHARQVRVFVDRAGRRLVGKSLRRDEIAPAQFGRVEL